MPFLKRKRTPLTLLSLVLVVLYLLFLYAEPQLPRDAAGSLRTTPTTVLPSLIPSVSVTETQVLAESDALLFPVVKVADGDTITVLMNNKRETIRLIGINTPETVDPRKKVECFGQEASLHAKQLLTNASVRLESDPTQSERDRYNRLLRYVYLEDGRFFNQLMIREGYAYEYTYGSVYKYQEEFKTAEQQARDAKVGLWNEATCRGTL